MAQLKVIHNDSNKSRAKDKKEKEKQLQQSFSSTDLNDTTGYFIADDKLYFELTKAIESMNVTHLTDIDKFSLVSVANTMFYIQLMDKEIVRLGITQEQLTREGSTKYTTLQHISTRSGLVTTLQKQIGDLMLTPAQRMALIDNVKNSLDSINLDTEEMSALYEEIMQ